MIQPLRRIYVGGILLLASYGFLAWVGESIGLHWLLFLWSAGALVLGAIICGASWVHPAREPDLLVAIAWSLSSALIIAWLSIGAFMACFALTHTLLIAHVSLAVLAGVLCGLTANWWARSKLKATGLPTEAPPNGGRAARPNQESSRRVLQIGVPRGFLTVPLFLLGLIVGLIIVESVDSACTLTGIRGQKTGTSTGYVVQVHYDHEARADLVSMLVLAVLTVLACLTAKWNRIPISTFVGAAPVFALWMFGIGRSHFLDWGLWCVLAVCLLLSIACFAWLSSQRRRG